MLSRAVAILLFAVSCVAMSSAPASADDGCPGTRESWRQFRDSAGTVAAVLQFYDTANGACLNLVSKNQYAGTAKYMRIRVCNLQREACTEDSGQYAYYAGPIYRSIPDDALHCVSVRSTMHYQGEVIMDHWDNIGHCN